MNDIKDISEWRQRIFTSLLPTVLVVGTATTAAIFPILVQQRMWLVTVADFFALAWIFAIWQLKSLSYTTRVFNFLGVVYVLSLVLMHSIGPASFSYLLGPPIVAAILLSLRPALVAIALGDVSLIALGAADCLALSVPGWEYDPLKASLVAALNYSSVAVMLTLICNSLLKGLSISFAQLELTSAAVSRLNDMVIIANAAKDPSAVRPISFVNEALLRRTGYARHELIGQSLQVLCGKETDRSVIACTIRAMLANEPYSTEMLVYTHSGGAFWIELELMPFARPGEPASHWVIVGRDITERRAAAESIHSLAYYDALTGLPNRRLLMEQLSRLLEETQDNSTVSAVLYLDLDNFKDVNDARGHAAGDAVLCLVAARLRQTLRGNDIVARIGGDEFVVLLEKLSPIPKQAVHAALGVAEKIREALATPLDLDGQFYRIGVSIGVALSLQPTSSAHDVLREADTAMYRAKARGRNGVVLFEDAMLVEAQHKLTLERDLAKALESGEMTMHYQLQVDQLGKPVGAELLMRWHRTDGTSVRPDIFIPVAESSGLIVPLGNWALRQACEAWLELAQAGHALPLSVNVSPLQFRQRDFVEQVRTILKETGASPQHLIFEVTEGLLIEDIGQAITRMHELAHLGIRFSVDDFGTGYSNMAYLTKMPLYELKIDKSLMQEVPHNLNSTSIVQAILAMAGHLGLRVVAEGIEYEAQVTMLAAHSNTYMQGFLHHRPVPLKELIDRLSSSALRSSSTLLALAQ